VNFFKNHFSLIFFIFFSVSFLTSNPKNHHQVMNFLKIPLTLLIITNLAHAASILAILQYPFYSHQLLYHKLMTQLAIRGHNLTIFTSHTFNYDNYPNVVQHHFENSTAISDRHTNMLEYKQKRLNWLQIMDIEQKAFFETTKSEIAHPEMQKLIHDSGSRRFDLIIIECHHCHLAYLAEIYDCPIAHVAASDVSSVWHGLMGNDVSPALYADTFFTPFLDRHLTFAERIESLAVGLVLAAKTALSSGTMTNELQTQHFPGMSMTIDRVMMKRSALLMTHTSAAFGHVRPVMVNTVQVGFMHVEPPRVINDTKLLQFLDESTNGVVVMSLGSKADTRSLDRVTVAKFMSAFNMTDLNVIWKSHKSGQTAPANVMVHEWLPLADVLAHPNVKVLITHGGLLTAYEAIDRQVPMIVFPLAYDQGANARMLVHKGVAVELDLNTFTEQQLLSAIDEVKRDEFKVNVKKLRERVYDQPIPARDLAVFSIERAIRNGNDLLVPTSGYEEQLQRYYVDVIAMSLSVAASFSWIVLKICKK
jgi:glucuronosyltransferase